MRTIILTWFMVTDVNYAKHTQMHLQFVCQAHLPLPTHTEINSMFRVPRSAIRDKRVVSVQTIGQERKTDKGGEAN